MIGLCTIRTCNPVCNTQIHVIHICNTLIHVIMTVPQHVMLSNRNTSIILGLPPWGVGGGLTLIQSLNYINKNTTFSKPFVLREVQPNNISWIRGRVTQPNTRLSPKNFHLLSVLVGDGEFLLRTEPALPRPVVLLRDPNVIEDSVAF